MRPLFLAISFLVALASTAFAERELILIPYWTETPVPGAYGSLWVTDLAILNDSGEPIRMEGYDHQYKCPGRSGCDIPATPPGVTFFPRLSIWPDGRNRMTGAFLVVEPASAADRVVVKLRTRDISREGFDWGVEIPTITESSAPVERFTILDVPTDSRYRAMLRLYQFHPEPTEARVRFFASPPTWISSPFYGGGRPPDVLLVEETITMTARRDIQHLDHWPQWQRLPGYAEIQMLTQRHPALLQTQRIRIEVTSLTEGVRMWGFVTLTNNETQRVTVMSP